MTYQKDSIVYQPKPTASNFIDITNRTFGRLTVLGYAGRSLSKRQQWFCECICGNIKIVRQGNLHSGQVTSCGCIRDEKIGALNRTHGMANTHPLYLTWCNMRRRCYDVNYPKYLLYNEHGIKVCRNWRESFPAFLEDMGEKPSAELSIERVNNDGHYSCGHCAECIENGWIANCIWGTPRIQAGNTRTNRHLTFNGKTQILADWAREVGIPYSCLNSRLNRYKWSVEKSLTTPLQQR